MKSILVVGGGFAGLGAVLNAADQSEPDDGIQVSLISDQPFLTIRPRLYEQQPETLKVDLQPILDAAGVGLEIARVSKIDTNERTLCLAGQAGDETIRTYDRLILTAGSVLQPPPVPGLSAHGLNIDNQQEAVRFDAHLKKVATLDGENANGYVIIGAGMTGIELAAELRMRIAAHGGAQRARDARVVLVDKAARIGHEFGDEPRPVILAALDQAGIETRLGVEVRDASASGVRLDTGERIAAATIVVATGMRANPLAAQIPGRRDELGRLHVDEMLKVTGVDHVFAAGDVAHAMVDDGHSALMSCQHARTMGKYAGVNATCDLTGRPLIAYRQGDYTTCLDLGAAGAVFTTGWDRRVAGTGAKAKTRKQMINTQWIYPPEATDRESVLAGMRIDERGR